MLERKEFDLYKKTMQEEGLLPCDMLQLSPRNQALSQPREREAIYVLNSRRGLTGWQNEKTLKGDKEAEKILKADMEDEKKLYGAIVDFRRLWNKQDAFTYLSKYTFAEHMISYASAENTDFDVKELLLRFVTDRSFYFEQYRELGNLPGDEDHPPAPSIEECIFDEDLWRTFEKKPADILKQGLKRMESALKRKTVDRSKDPSDSCTPKKADDTTVDQWFRLAADTFQEMTDPEPLYPIKYEDLLKKFNEKCEKTGVPKLDRSNESDKSDTDYEYVKYIEKMLFGGYRYLLEEYTLVRLTIENEWIPTNIHRKFYEESNDNYRHLCMEMQRREDYLRSKNILVKKLNSLAQSAASTTERSQADLGVIPKPVHQKLSRVLDIFETYARSQLHTARRTEFKEILTHQDCSNRNLDCTEVWRKPYTVSICRLLEACWSNDEWNILTPLFLYHAFAQNSQVVMRNSKKKLVKKIIIPKESSSIWNMASTTGYRAGINLVLYQKLSDLFRGQLQDCCLLERAKDSCANIPYRDLSVSQRITVSGCALKGRRKSGENQKYQNQNETAGKEKRCPFCCLGQDWNDFGFYLTTGYVRLYHHYPIDDVIRVPYREIYREKTISNENEKEFESEDEIVPQRTTEGEKTYPVYRYQLDLRHPVGVLEGLLEHHIKNCIPNRPRDMTLLTPNSYSSNSLHPPYEELANLLLQDMHLPAMRRISRYIKRILSEHSEYLEEFRMFLRYPGASSERSRALDKIIKKHGMEALILRYSDYSLSFRSYSVYDSLRTCLEYMLRAKLIEEVQNELRPIVFGCISQDLFAYQFRKRKSEMKK